MWEKAVGARTISPPPDGNWIPPRRRTNGRRWYGDLLVRIERKRAEIVALGGEDGFAYMLAVYGGMLGKIEGGLLSGVLLNAFAITMTT